jgi:hypothetical protein
MRRLAIVLLLAAAAPASAADSGRFAFVPSESGILRLDTATGEVALCMERGGSLVCLTSPRPAGDGAAPRQAERFAEMEARIAALEARSDAPAAPDRGEAISKVKILAERMAGRVATLVKRMKGRGEEL